MAFPLLRSVALMLILPIFIWGSSSEELEKNEIPEHFDRNEKQQGTSLPKCDGNSICAFLQANARGINVQQLCSCQSPFQLCSLKWDSDDGRSITQGSDQYKYCHKAPVLKYCQRGMRAYTTVSIISKTSGRLLSLKDINHCICPERFNYKFIDSMVEDIDEENESMEVIYVCNALKPCNTGEVCKVITETSSTFLVNRLCRCRGSSNCPTVPTSRYSRRLMPILDTVLEGNGLVHKVRCH